ncbi:unnamed protein product, partial [Oppiella nova]
MGCDMSFISNYKLDEHVKRVHPNARPFMCPNCHNTYKRAINLKIHENKCKSRPNRHRATPEEELDLKRCVLDDQKTYRCDWPHCQQVLANRYRFMGHIRAHRGDYRFPCNECDKKYTLKDLLMRHKKLCHNTSPDNLLECRHPDCQFTTRLQSKLEMHYNEKHMSERLFKCRINGCKLSFKLKEDLIKHKAKKHVKYVVNGN